MIAATPTWLFTYRYLSTSREAGNTKVRLLSCKYLLITVQLPIYLARVRKTKVKLAFRIQVQFRIVTYLPREGTETQLDSSHCHFLHLVQIPIYLERGRKPIRLNCELRLVSSVQIPMNLERGRKQTSLTTRHTLQMIWYSYLSTSRGDGNP